MGRIIVGKVGGREYYYYTTSSSSTKRRVSREYETALKQARLEAAQRKDQAYREAERKRKEEQAAEQRVYEKQLERGRVEPERLDKKTNTQITDTNRVLDSLVDAEVERLKQKYPGSEDSINRENIRKQFIYQEQQEPRRYEAYEGEDVSRIWSRGKARIQATAGTDRVYLPQYATEHGPVMPFVRELHARQHIPYGGAMAGDYVADTEEDRERLYQYGAQRLFEREASRPQAGREAIPAKPQFIVEKTPERYVVGDKEFKTRTAAEGYAERSQQLEEWKQKGVFERQKKTETLAQIVPKQAPGEKQFLKKEQQPKLVKFGVGPPQIPGDALLKEYRVGIPFTDQYVSFDLKRGLLPDYTQVEGEYKFQKERIDQTLTGEQRQKAISELEAWRKTARQQVKEGKRMEIGMVGLGAGISLGLGGAAMTASGSVGFGVFEITKLTAAGEVGGEAGRLTEKYTGSPIAGFAVGAGAGMLTYGGISKIQPSLFPETARFTGYYAGKAGVSDDIVMARGKVVGWPASGKLPVTREYASYTTKKLGTTFKPSAKVTMESALGQRTVGVRGKVITDVMDKKVMSYGTFDVKGSRLYGKLPVKTKVDTTFVGLSRVSAVKGRSIPQSKIIRPGTVRPEFFSGVGQKVGVKAPSQKQVLEGYLTAGGKKQYVRASTARSLTKQIELNDKTLVTGRDYGKVVYGKQGVKFPKKVSGELKTDMRFTELTYPLKPPKTPLKPSKGPINIRVQDIDLKQKTQTLNKVISAEQAKQAALKTQTKPFVLSGGVVAATKQTKPPQTYPTAKFKMESVQTQPLPPVQTTKHAVLPAELMPAFTTKKPQKVRYVPSKTIVKPVEQTLMQKKTTPRFTTPARKPAQIPIQETKIETIVKNKQIQFMDFVSPPPKTPTKPSYFTPRWGWGYTFGYPKIPPFLAGRGGAPTRGRPRGRGSRKRWTKAYVATGWQALDLLIPGRKKKKKRVKSSDLIFGGE